MDRSAHTKIVSYRAFLVNDKGHLGSLPRIIEAHDDTEAEQQAIGLADQRTVELWEGARLVARVAPQSRALHAPSG